MVRLLIEASRTDDDGNVHEESLYKLVEWQVLPRIGEMFSLGGGFHPVVSIYHDFEGKNANITVTVAVEEQSYQVLQKNGGWHTDPDAALPYA